ncbi:facilitated trehalose transporter Tret1-like [Anticarsia gemmatalis]|uniref:facilitated trehalose transporter Tret1-like n=1 Tax=Anticarsia gemmatalis TaxID=129554 RepID=UPI003F776521
MAIINVVNGAVPSHWEQSAHIYRQVFASVAAFMLTISMGQTLGFTAVLTPQLKNDPNFSYDMRYDSWIASTVPLAAIISCVFAGNLSDRIGRKMAQITLVLPFIIGWVITGFSTNSTQMLVGRFITGVCVGFVRPTTVVYVGELTEPQYRPIALFCLSAAAHLGILISHALEKCVHWKTACFLFSIPNIINVVILMFVKESPLWLLAKGKTEEGVESFRLFRGNSEKSEKELAKVLETSRKEEDKFSVKDMANTWSGGNTISFYAEDIFEKTFSGVDSFMLIMVTDSMRIVTTVIIYGTTALFAKFGFSALIAGVLLSILLPETNGRTLQDIEDSLYKKKDEKSGKDVATVPSSQ